MLFIHCDADTWKVTTTDDTYCFRSFVPPRYSAPSLYSPCNRRRRRTQKKIQGDYSLWSYRHESAH